MEMAEDRALRAEEPPAEHVVAVAADARDPDPLERQLESARRLAQWAGGVRDATVAARATHRWACA